MRGYPETLERAFGKIRSSWQAVFSGGRRRARMANNDRSRGAEDIKAV
jgi:hypothetical protein